VGRKMNNDPILITGTARSGISLIAEVIHLCGAFTIPAFNGKIQHDLIKPFFRGIGADPTGQSRLPDIERCKYLTTKNICKYWPERVGSILLESGYKDGPWFYADPKSCLIWPIWAEAFPKVWWIIVRRKDDDIIQSCLKTGYMSAHKDISGWLQWIEEHKKRFKEMIDGELNIWQIWPQRMVQGKLDEVKAMIQKLGLTWNEKGVKDFITPILWTEGIFETDEQVPR